MQQADDHQILGQVDECRPLHDVGRIGHRQILVPGERVFIRGWVLRRDGGPVDVQIAWGEERRAIAVSEERLDVMASQGAKARYSGFRSTVDIDELPVGPFEIDVFVRSAGGTVPLNGAPVAFFRAGAPLPDQAAAEDGARGRIRRIADADPFPLPAGWPGRRSIRPGRPVEITGWALDPHGGPPESIVVEVVGDDGIARHYAAALRFDGEATAANRSRTPFVAGFACAVGPDELPAGFYLATILLEDGQGRWWRGPQGPFQVLGADAALPPRFLPVAVSAPNGRLESSVPREVVRGTPIVLRGRAADPATGRTTTVYAAFDERIPGPVASLSSPPDTGSADGPDSFSGIADTRDLLPGDHRLRVLALATSGALWYTLGDYRLRVFETATSANENLEGLDDRRNGTI